jgi:hypothetical protein
VETLVHREMTSGTLRAALQLANTPNSHFVIQGCRPAATRSPRVAGRRCSPTSGRTGWSIASAPADAAERRGPRPIQVSAVAPDDDGVWWRGAAGAAES